MSETNNKIPATMRAAVYRGINDVRVETVPAPLDADGGIGAGEVLVRIDTCGICGTDLKRSIRGRTRRRASLAMRWRGRLRWWARASRTSPSATA